MPKYTIAIARPSSNGWERSEVGTFLFQATEASTQNPEIAPYIQNLLHIPLTKFPTNVCRNILVRECQNMRVDYLMMVDNDSEIYNGIREPSGKVHPGTFETFFTFLRKQSKPSVIAAPYCSGDGQVQVLKFTTDQVVQHPLDSFRIMQTNREFAASKTGFEKVDSIGTHCIMFDMRVFDAIPKPYFSYQYNEDETEVIETEDCWCMRHLFYAGVPVYCGWDFWSGHFKESRIYKPPVLDDKAVPEYFMKQAEAKLLADGWSKPKAT